MSRRTRLLLFGVAVVGFGVVLVLGLSGLPAFGDYKGVYGNVINDIGVTERHATDLVTALNFDIRAFDTLGEEFILFASVLGVVLILRQMRGEHERPSQHEGDEHTFGGASEALRALSLVLIPVILAIGVYIVVHGQITPGGGFQGGVILAAGPLAVFLAGRYLRMKIVAPHTLVELGEAVGAVGYALVGMGGLIFAGVFFKNFLPLGAAGRLLSAGQMDVASAAVGLEVSGAFLVAFSEFLDQAVAVQSDPSESAE
ncbi:MAG: MnhB domain-containing protein [Solirubrobacteraceae bacterium]